MKIAVIGGGSSYTPELIQGFLSQVRSLPLEELWLVDVDSKRLDVVGGFAQRMIAAQGNPFSLRLTMDQEAGIKGSDYVITQLRVGGMAARTEDEYLGKRHGLIGQETTGVGGMSKALRTIPILLQIAQDLERLAPKALLINFTNPAGLITEALARYAPRVESVGVCNVPITAKMEMLGWLENRQGVEIDPSRVELETLGLNHLSWHRGFKLDGSDVWPVIMRAFLDELAAEEGWDLETITALNLIPNYYLQYYYYQDRKLAEQQNWPPSRAEQVQEIEKGLLEHYAHQDRDQLPEELLERGGAFYSTLATQLIRAHFNDLKQTYVANVPHRGAVAGWPQDWVLELPCSVGRDGIQPLAADPLPEVCFGLIAQVKGFELLTVEAAVHGDREAAYQALLANPLGPSADKIQAVLEDMLQTHQTYLPQFLESR